MLRILPLIIFVGHVIGIVSMMLDCVLLHARARGTPLLCMTPVIKPFTSNTLSSRVWRRLSRQPVSDQPLPKLPLPQSRNTPHGTTKVTTATTSTCQGRTQTMMKKLGKKKSREMPKGKQSRCSSRRTTSRPWRKRGKLSNVNSRQKQRVPPRARQGQPTIHPVFSHSSGSLWALKAGNTKLLLVDYTNITSWPDEAVSKARHGGPMPPKADFVTNATGHINISGETHTQGDSEIRMINHILRRKPWWAASAAAEPSDASKGSHGGLLLQSEVVPAHPAAGWLDSAPWSMENV